MPERTDRPSKPQNKGVSRECRVDLPGIDQMIVDLLSVRHTLRDVPVCLAEQRRVLLDVVDHADGVAQRLALIGSLLGR